MFPTAKKTFTASDGASKEDSDGSTDVLGMAPYLLGTLATL